MISLTLGHDLVKNPSHAYRLMLRFLPSDDHKDIACALWGIFSGFPLCCIWFHITKWRPLGYREGFQMAHARWPQVAGVGHVECERCYARRQGHN